MSERERVEMVQRVERIALSARRRHRYGIGVGTWPRITISVRPSLHEALFALARTKGHSVSEMIGRVLERFALPYLDDLPDQPDRPEPPPTPSRRRGRRRGQGGRGPAERREAA